MSTQKAIDVNGSEIVSTVLLKLLNDFPGLNGKHIKFSILEDKTGMAFFPVSGATIVSRKESITGHVSMQCSYPFNIIYRVATKTETQKLTVKEFLDALGKWLEQQPIVINGEEIKLPEYPYLDSGRVITSIERTSPGHLSAVYQDGVEDWAISINLKYENDYDKNIF